MKSNSHKILWCVKLIFNGFYGKPAFAFAVLAYTSAICHSTDEDFGYKMRIFLWLRKIPAAFPSPGILLLTMQSAPG
jgi:hypothetical protein